MSRGSHPTVPRRSTCAAQFSSGLRGRDNGCAGIDKHAIAHCMVVMVVRIEEKTHGLSGGFFDFGQDLLRPPWVVGIHRKHVIPEHHPNAIGRFLLKLVTPVVEHSRSELANDGVLTTEPRSGNEQKPERQDKRSEERGGG